MFNQSMPLILAAGFSDFMAAIGPILAVIISGIFTYMGIVLNKKSKDKDQKLVEQTQKYDGIKTGQQFMKEALEEARIRGTELRKEMAEMKTAHQTEIDGLKAINLKLQVDNANLTQTNRELQAKLTTLVTETIPRLESEVRILKERSKP